MRALSQCAQRITTPAPIHSTGRTGTRAYLMPRVDYDPLSERLHDAAADVQPAFAGVSSYTLQQGWWLDAEPTTVDGTRLTVRNELSGHGVENLLARLALRAVREDAEAFTQRMKRAVEAS